MALFKKDKSEKKKGENVIGKIIYGFLLFAPLLSVLFSCLYVVFNKNAYQSYSGANENQIEYRFETNEVSTIDDLQVGNLYRYIPNENNLPSTNTNLAYCSFVNLQWNNGDNNEYNYQIDVDKINSNIYLQFVITSNSTLLYIRNATNTQSIISFGVNRIEYLDFQFLYSVNQNFISDINASPYNEIKGVTLSNEGTLDNVFEYSITKVENSNLYNWSKQTGTYTVLETTCNGLGITNTFAPMLLAYWLLISIIYFLFDIALILIWAVHDKIHELKDSI